MFIIFVGFFLNCGSVKQHKAIGIKKLDSENSPSILSLFDSFVLFLFQDESKLNI